MLVGNKSDMAAQRRTPRELGEEFAQHEELLFTEASAKSGEGVEDMFLSIGECRALAALTPAKALPLTAPPVAKPGVKVAPKKEEGAQSACTC